jgi:hypothetical protein
MIDTPDIPPDDIKILEHDPFILLQDIDTRSGLAKGRRCRAVQMKKRTVVFQFDNNKTRTSTRIPMEFGDDQTWSLTRIPIKETSNGMAIIFAFFSQESCTSPKG